MAQNQPRSALAASSDVPARCSFCSRGSESLNCPACARAAVLPIRVAHASTLLDERELERHASAVLQKHRTGAIPDSLHAAAYVNVQESAQKLKREQAWDEIDETRHRIALITERAKALKSEMEGYGRMIQERKTLNAEKSRAVAAGRTALTARRDESTESTKKATRRINLRLDSLNSQVVTSRAYLCREAAALAGLQQRRRKAADGKTQEAYNIGGIPILDLRELNTGPPQQITTALGHVARLLVLVCHYLHVRLPAEITLPHKQYPLASICPPSASYQSTDFPFPTLSSSNHSSNSSPKASRTLDNKPSVRPRPLFLDNRKLPLLAKEDPAAYAIFVDGVALLAWDVAWLCRTQGHLIGSVDWEDFCNIGKNLWNLLVANPSDRPTLLRKISPTPAPRQGEDRDVQPSHKSLLGVYSHGTARNFLGAEEAAGSMARAVSTKDWRYATPVKLLDRIKAFLQSDMSGAEWEVVKEDEYRDAGTGKLEDTPVIVNGKGHTRRTRTVDGDESSDANGNANASGGEGMAKPRGASGWTKLRSRAGET